MDLVRSKSVTLNSNPNHKSRTKREKDRSRGAAPPPNKKRRPNTEQIEDEGDKETREETSGFQQPALVTGGTLKSYQADGVAWMVSLWENGISGILGM